MFTGPIFSFVLRTFVPLMEKYDIDLFQYMAVPWRKARETQMSFEEFLRESLTSLKKKWDDAKLPSLEPFVDSLSGILKNLTYIRRCSLAVQAFEIINIVVTLGWLKHVNFEYKGISIFRSESLRRQVSVMDLLEAVGKFAKTFMSCLLNFLETWSFEAFYADAIKYKYEDNYTMLMSKKTLIEVGKLDMDPHEYDRILSEMITDTVALLDKCKDGERFYYSSRLKDMRNLQVQRTVSQRDYIRQAPYGILLYGGSSVGKSSIANALIRYVLKINGFDSSPKSIITLNEFDKYQSEYRTHHGGVIFDDLCNGKTDKTVENPLMKVIQFINNAPMAALNPQVELKGNIMIEPNVVLATTNVKHLNAHGWSNEPLSIARRFNVTITQELRPEYVGSDGLMDKEKVAADFTGVGFPDYALFTVEEAQAKPTVNGVGVNYVPFEFQGKTMEKVDIKTLLAFLKEHSEKHYAAQRALVATQRGLENIELNEEGFPVEFDSQFLDGLSDVSEHIIALEEKMMSWIEERIRAFLRTKYGHYLLAAYHRTFLMELLFTTGKWLAIFGAFSLWNELVAGFRGLTMFISGVIVALCYILVRVYLQRRRVILRLSTLPRPSKYVMALPMQRKLQLLSAIGGTATLALIVKLVKQWKEIPTSHAAAPLKHSAFPKSTEEELPPSWGTAGRAAKEASYKTDAQMEHRAKSSNLDKLKSVVTRRQYLLLIGKEGEAEFCNAVPLKDSILLIPNHVVPSGATPARLVKDGANPKHVYLTPESCYRIPNTDFALWYLPEMGTQRDLLMYFPDHISRGMKFDGTLVYNDSGKVKEFPMMQFTRGYNTTSKGGSFESVVYSFPGTTFNGLCMATVVARDRSRAPFIAGFHLGGKGSLGCAGFITRQQVIDGMAQLNKRPSILSSHSSAPMRTEVCGVKYSLSAPHEKCVTNELPSTAKCTIFGGHSQPRGSPSSSVVTSMISGAVTQILGLPRLHDKPHEMGSRMHKEVDIAGKTDTAYKFEGASVDKAVVDYKTTVFQGLTDEMLATVGVLDDDANLAGLDGVQGINAMQFDTSAGFPFRGTKEQFVTKSDRFVEGISCPRDIDPIILEEVSYLEQELKARRRVNLVFKGALKDEPTKMTKKKVRVFAGCNIAATFLIRKYFLTLSALMQNNKELFECAVTINPKSPEWTKLMNHIYRFGIDRVVAGDYKSFDGRMSPRFMLAGFKILIAIAEKSGNYDEDDLTIMRGIATEITNPTYDYFGTLVQFFGSNPSGHPLTVVINSIVNSLYMRYCYYEIAKQEKWWRVPAFNQVVSLMTYGDDNIMSVKPGYDAYNHTRIASVLAEAGITYTMADKEAESVPFIHGSEAGFLKRDAIWDPELKIYRAALDETSISKQLHAHLESKALTEEQHSAEGIIGAMDEYFEYGREVYDRKREQLTEVARQAGLSGYVGELKTYDEQVDRLLKKYPVLDSQSGKEGKKSMLDYCEHFNECTVSENEEFLQRVCMQDLAQFDCVAKEYPMGPVHTGDLIFMDPTAYFSLVVEVKCCFGNANTSRVYRNKARKQAAKLAKAHAALFPKNYVVGAIYTFDGLEVVTVSVGDEHEFTELNAARKLP
ncbi:hypothetical protein 1 [Beihai sipunculid worm virus 2]|uniref:hypothetical protein 1 n=1 Tax=Beihai sipunculid worm virus 2 TaxID=1922674 RepID=UPI00090CC8DD|nr:hypothetical protein 1 [Beihai sipunculid worm virus 2]APG76858.1 hypothetical protein 1 [Beihai sipunculid worm virus 2]